MAFASGGVTDSRTMTPENSRYCLPRSYISRPQAKYYVDTAVKTRGEIWQPKVYAYARALARAHQLTHIVDIGCGTGQKLAELSPEFQIAGIDFGSNLDTCRKKFPHGSWFSADFENDSPLPVPESILPRCVLICSDVIEHLVRPEILLGNLLALLDRAPFLVLSTPDRTMSGRGGFGSPPANPHHVREWTFSELKRFLAKMGFTMLDHGWTQTVDVSPGCGTSLFILGKKPSPDFKPHREFRHRSRFRSILDSLRAIRHFSRPRPR